MQIEILKHDMAISCKLYYHILKVFLCVLVDREHVCMHVCSIPITFVCVLVIPCSFCYSLRNPNFASFQ